MEIWITPNLPEIDPFTSFTGGSSLSSATTRPPPPPPFARVKQGADQGLRRWSSCVFQIYAKDIDKCMEVQWSFLKVMTQIKLHITPNPRKYIIAKLSHSPS